jgi:diguanylate cyclase (GGDEF)-like protein
MRPSLTVFSRASLAVLALAAGLVVWGLGMLWNLPPGGNALVPAGYVALGALLAGVAAILLWRILRWLAADLDALAATAGRARSAPLVLEAPHCRLEETAGLGEALMRVTEALATRQEALEEAAHTDPVTGLANRGYFFKQLRHAFELARRGNHIGLLLLEVEGLAKAVDLLGHEAGERLLRMLAETLNAQTRRSDLAARLGVHDFAVLYYNTEPEGLRARLAELVSGYRRRQEQSSDTGGRAHCTLVLGLTILHAGNDARPEDAFLRAQQALRAARAQEGTRIEVRLAADQ